MPSRKSVTALSIRLLDGLLALLLLLPGCQPDPGVAPRPARGNEAGKTAAREAAVSQTLTRIDGITVQVECRQETLATGEIIQICMPTPWNGSLILYAHGYVSEFEPLRLPLEASQYAPLYTSLGFAFATSSLRENGLAIQTGIDDMLNLRKRFVKQHGEPQYTYLTGGSQGGIITTLAVERYPRLLSGGLSLCGPCGDFGRQVNYYGDFRVLFDYYFPNVLPGDAVNIPDELIQNWAPKYVLAVVQALNANPAATFKLLSVAEAPYDPANPATIAQTVLGVLWYDVFTTRDAVRKLGGQPFDNTRKVYGGTGSPAGDALLNAQVQRFAADPKAAKNIAKYYETSGDIAIPLVTAHTTGDPIQLFWHLGLYGQKVMNQGKGPLFTGIPVNRYGHCTFTQAEIAVAFNLLVRKVTGQPLPLVGQLAAQANPATGLLVTRATTPSTQQ